MFTKEITNSSDFLMMSQSAQNLYFHFGMNADDDGFCEVFTVMRMTDSKPDDLKALHERGLIFVVDGKVCIVKDWHENNQLRADRYKQSKYMDDPKYRDIYMIVMEDKIKEISLYKELLDSGIPNGNQTAPQYRLGKDSKDTDSLRSSDFLKVEVADDDDVPARPKADPNTKKVVAYWLKKCVDEVGQAPSTTQPAMLKVVKDAHIHLTYSQIREKIDEWFQESGLEDYEKIQIRRCFSKVQIDKFKSENI